MPRPIGVIQKPGLFEDLVRRIGVNRPSQPFILDGDVIPVVLVDSAVSFVAAPTPAYTVPDIFTEGPQTNPAAGDILATTGPLAVGFYSVQLNFTTTELNDFDLEWRNAGDTATLIALRFRAAPSQLGAFLTRMAIVNANERFRFVTVGASAAAQVYAAQLLVRI